MNRLQLLQRAHAESGLLGSPPTTTISQTGHIGKLVDRIDEAWRRIQGRRLWDFLWESATVTITANTNATAETIAARRYVIDTARNSSGASLSYMPWSEFTHAYPSAFIAAGTPSTWTIRPDKYFVVNAKPTSNYAITVERYKNPTAMSANGDTPTGLPTDLHMLIVWAALMLYAGPLEHVALYKHAANEYRKMLSEAGLQETETPHWGAAW